MSIPRRVRRARLHHAAWGIATLLLCAASALFSLYALAWALGFPLAFHGPR